MKIDENICKDMIWEPISILNIQSDQIKNRLRDIRDNVSESNIVFIFYNEKYKKYACENEKHEIFLIIDLGLFISDSFTKINGIVVAEANAKGKKSIEYKKYIKDINC